MFIKDWKEREIIREHGGFIEDINGVVRESEKAYLLSIRIGYSSSCGKSVNVWVPKSCVETDEEHFAAQKAYEEQLEKRFEAGKKEYDKMLAWAKEHGVKGVREGLKKATILGKIKAAGLVYEA